MSYIPRYVWKIFCINNNEYETTISASEPTVCPTDGSPIDPSRTEKLAPEFQDIFSNGYINIESVLSDNQAILIKASNINGGILMNAGIGGILVNTTNAISLNAQAASNFTTTTGNLTLNATSGLLNMDSGSGINLGNNPSTSLLNIGTSSNSKNITIGNTTGSTSVQTLTGTGGFILDTANGGPISLDSIGTTSNFTNTTNADGQDLNFALLGSTLSSINLMSQGIGVDSININSNGGIQIIDYSTDSSNIINIISNAVAGGAITLDTFSGGGGISLSSGSFGIIINANGGPIGLGNFSNGDILIGTSSGNRTITIGNNSTGTRFFERFGDDGFIKTQQSEVILTDTDSTLTVAQLLTGIITITPTTNRTLTLPTAANVVGGIPGLQINDSMDFCLINKSSSSNQASLIISPGIGGSINGNNSVPPYQNLTGSFFTSGSSLFRLKITNLSSGTESYIVYRIS